MSGLRDAFIATGKVVYDIIMFKVTIGLDVLVLNYGGTRGDAKTMFNLVEKLDTYSLLE